MLLVAVTVSMTPMVAARLNVIRSAAGTRAMNPFSRKPPETEPAESDAAELLRLIEAWNPMPAAVVGFGGFVVILWLMLFKPF